LDENIDHAGASTITSKTLHDLRIHFGRLLLALLWVLLSGVTIIAADRGVWTILVPLIGVTLVGLATALWLRDPIGPLTRYVSSAAMSGIVALFVLELNGNSFKPICILRSSLGWPSWPYGVVGYRS
jgi:hypothetical protein